MVSIVRARKRAHLGNVFQGAAHVWERASRIAMKSRIAASNAWRTIIAMITYFAQEVKVAVMVLAPLRVTRAWEPTIPIVTKTTMIATNVR